MRYCNNKYVFNAIFKDEAGVAVIGKDGLSFYKKGTPDFNKCLKTLPEDVRCYCLSEEFEYHVSMAGRYVYLTGKSHSYLEDEYTGGIKELVFPADEQEKLALEILGKLPPAVSANIEASSNVEKALKAALMFM